VRNLAKYREFKAMKNRILQMGFEPSEMALFHGAGNAYQKILDTGFNLTFAKESGLFGRGIYFADRSSKSNQYT